MSTHPSSLALEAFACGEETDAVRAHLATCGACAAFVKRFAEESAAFASVSIGSIGSIDAMISNAEARAASMKANATDASEIESTSAVATKTDATSNEKSPTKQAAAKEEKSNVIPIMSRTNRAVRASFVLIPLVTAAACIMVYLRQDPRAMSPVTSTTVIDDTYETPSTSFKGEMQIAVVRERGGEQLRFTRDLSVREGDRVRIEVALDRSRTIMAGVLADDGTFVSLMPEAARGAGTHFSDNAAHFDADPTRGYVIVGTPDAIQKSIAAKKPVGVNAMRLNWEAP